jgi:7-cyano-7-deazaguanine tRNA-ribosyltransferase
MQIVAGISLKNLHPRVWDAESPFYMPQLEAVMISYADFAQNPAARKKAMAVGLHQLLGIPDHIRIYLDNGAFYFIGHGGDTPRQEYEDFVAQARPDWWPIPQDFIPIPHMSHEDQERCFQRTMAMNRAYDHDGFVPVIHISRFLQDYIVAMRANERLAQKPTIALGGIVPNLLRASKAIPYAEILTALQNVRRIFADKRMHVFGIGGTATLHIAALLEIDSVDSSGWRNRAARGIVQLPGSGDRMVANLGKWRGRAPSEAEWETLRACPCPACQTDSIVGLTADKGAGFRHRATHNLWILLNETRWIADKLATGSYAACYQSYLDNTIYLPLIEQLVRARFT